MQWLIKLKKQFNDPIDCLRLNIIAENKTPYLVAGRWLYPTIPSYKQISQKKQRIKNSLQKIYFAQKFKNLFKYGFPFVEFIGISGSVSSLGAKKNDDIDLFIITQPKRLGLSRLIDWLILNLLKTRRNRQTTDDQYNNKLCCNYYLDSQSLALLPKDRNDQNALEIAELIPLFDRRQGEESYYLKLLQANSWVKKFLPQWYKITMQNQVLIRQSFFPKSRWIKWLETFFILGKWSLDILEIIVGLPQQILIKRTLSEYKIKLFAKRWQFWRSRK